MAERHVRIDMNTEILEKGQRSDENGALQPPTPSARRIRRTMSLLKHVEKTPHNPWVNRTYPSSRAEKLKVVLGCVFLMWWRVIGIILTIFLGWIISSVVLIGVPRKNRTPLSKWRFAIARLMQPLVRLLLWFLGYLYIETKGKPVSSREAPIVVCNHQTFVETLYFISVYFCSEVADASNLKIPFVRSIVRAMQMLLLDRQSPTSRQEASEEIKRRCISERGKWPTLVIFPEGCTSNGECLLSFKRGAFNPGAPIQPVVVEYPYKFFHPSWIDGYFGPASIALHLLCSPFNRMKVTFLKPYIPSEAEKADPDLYCRNVRYLMADTMGAYMTEHSYSDLLLARRGVKLGLSFEEGMVETDKLAQFFDVTVDNMKHYMERFAQFNTSKTGKLNREEFIRIFGEPGTKLEDYYSHLFDLLDVDESGELDFREFLVGLLMMNEQDGGRRRGEDALRLVFGMMDSDGSGVVTKEQMRRMMIRVFPDEAPEYFDEFWKSADKAGGGKITVEQFMGAAGEW
eukprot:CAMPEP_0184671062 /NCGR_PEP_ID=MMETSP0308-20130426/85266_1 /TAXON_ID=38269 /ORGANISM="Gloeochaete witrockiana, Strain SAG 46.84" /LENGTH=514 /DNA_ID=CAMNT_0027118109 /DNA_START=71 /DNA_END=1612 /DNA_ORIENTATION=-